MRTFPPSCLNLDNLPLGLTTNSKAFARGIRGGGYLNEVLSLSLVDGDCKPLWQCIRFQKQDNRSISALKENGKLVSDATSKAEILSHQFSSVFTKNDGENAAKLAGHSYPLTNQLTINQESVKRLSWAKP